MHAYVGIYTYTHLGHDSGFEAMYATRPMCVRATDGHLMPVITTKPAGMTDTDWASLCGLAFGDAVFRRAHRHVFLAQVKL